MSSYMSKSILAACLLPACIFSGDSNVGWGGRIVITAADVSLFSLQSSIEVNRGGDLQVSCQLESTCV